MKEFWVTTRHFMFAAIITVVSACLLHTQVVLLELSKIDINISISKRLYMSGQDIVGLTPTYGSVILIGLLVSFLVAFALRKYVFSQSYASYYLYPLASGFAMLTILIAMQGMLELTFLASARSFSGISLQVLAGLVGGLCFANLRMRHAQKAKL